MPLFQLPQLLNQIVNAQVALGRLQELLAADSQDPIPQLPPAKEGVVHMLKASEKTKRKNNRGSALLQELPMQQIAQGSWLCQVIGIGLHIAQYIKVKSQECCCNTLAINWRSPVEASNSKFSRYHPWGPSQPI